MTLRGLDILGADDSLADVRGGSVLKRGSKGEAVKAVQGLLGIGADGDFGPATESAVKAFQGAHGLSADGKVGKDTLAALEKSPGVTRVDFAEDEVVPASAPKPSATAAPGATTKPATSEADATKKRNMIIALVLAGLGATGLAVAWKR